MFIKNYHVLGVDTFSNEDYTVGFFDDLEEAKKKADEVGGTMNMVYVYDKAGKVVHRAGTY
jgi:hypothetical protein